MAAVLRVDPERLRVAAAAQADVGRYISGMATGQLLATAAAAMSGLASGEACQYAGGLLDGVARAVSNQLSEHAHRVSSAADRYQRTDEDLGDRLRRLAQ